MNKRLKTMVEATLIGVICYVLSTYLPTEIGPVTLILGMVPLILYGLKRGWVACFWASFIWCGVGLLLGHSHFLSLSQGLIEYVIAVLFGSVAGIFYRPMQRALKNKKKPYGVLILASLCTCFSRFIWHFIAGVIFWANYAPKNMNPYLYSLVVNGLSGGITALTAIIIGSLLLYKMPSFLKDK